MNKYVIKGIVKCTLFGVVWGGILFVLALLIKGRYGYNFDDILFIEGIVVIISALLAALGGNPSGLNISALGNQNAQYVGLANLEITRLEREKTKSLVKNTVQIGLCTTSLIIGGVITVVLNFMV